MTVRDLGMLRPVQLVEMREKLKILKALLFCGLVAAALVTSLQISQVKAYGECPSGTRTSYSESRGCSDCFKPWEITKYTWLDVRWSCSNGSSYSYDEDGTCGSCR